MACGYLQQSGAVAILFPDGVISPLSHVAEVHVEIKTPPFPTFHSMQLQSAQYIPRLSVRETCNCALSIDQIVLGLGGWTLAVWALGTPVVPKSP